MARCSHCGKKGFFFKVNSAGVCKECERIVHLQEEQSQLERKIGDGKVLYDEIVGRARKDTNTELENVLAQIVEKRKELEAISLEHDLLEKKAASNSDKLRKLLTVAKSMQYSAKRYFDQPEISNDIVVSLLPKECEELLSTTVEIKLNLMDVRELRKLYSQNSRLIKQLLTKYQARYTTKTNMSIYRLMVIALEAELQNVLYNMKYSRLEKAIKDIKEITAKYERIAIDGNQNIAPTVTKFIGEVEYLFIEAIKIEYQYYVQRERIKEEQKALREQMRQAARERKLLEEERKKVEAEEEKYRKEISSIEAELAATDDPARIEQLNDRRTRVQDQLGEVEKKKDDIVSLMKGKAGYVYVISNYGSFGENIFKIGMTRRIDPQERIDELGSASLPFSVPHGE